MEATANAHNDGHDAHAAGHGTDTHSHGHDNPYLAHHFDSMEQQYDSGKLGMWVFLATELLMFGGLFCAYSVYRSNHPEVFLYAHQYLDTTWGAINTAVLLASSLTMAWAVRCAQLNQKAAMIGLCLATLLGGAGFMVIKAIEYDHKFHEYLGPGYSNQYNVEYTGAKPRNNEQGQKKYEEDLAQLSPQAARPHGIASTAAVPYMYRDPHAGTTDEAQIRPTINSGGSVASSQLIATEDDDATASPHATAHNPTDESTAHEIADGTGATHAKTPAHAGGGEHGLLAFTDLDKQLSRQRVNTFFGIYYCMTGLHGVHVLVGMGLIFWITYRAASTRAKAWVLPLIPLSIGAYLIFLASIDFVIPLPNKVLHIGTFLLYTGLGLSVLAVAWGAVRIAMSRRVEDVTGEFNETYFAPVDLVGLYWHLVDLIWIFLFPLLYLIHGKTGS